jgi:hypothetical protein
MKFIHTFIRFLQSPKHPLSIFLIAGLISLVQTGISVAQNCTTLYVITANDGKVYSVNVSSGAATEVTTMTTGRQNLSVGPDPSNTGSTVFTTSQTASGSTVYKANTSISTTLPAAVSGLTANPATSGATAGHVYGISSSRQLIQASPAPAANLGTITGDATWSGATVAGDGFFDSSGNLYTIVTSGSSHYLYKINIATLAATQVVQLSGTLPSAYQGIAFLNGKIYAGEIVQSGLLLLISYKVQLYEINPNTGQCVKGATTTPTSSSNFQNIDFATCEAFTPASGPTCNELFGVVGNTQTIYNVNLSTLATTQSADGSQTNQGNMAFGPVPSNLSQNQFVTSPNNASGNIYTAVNGSITLSSTGNTWGSPIGLGTDPATGIVYGINSKTLTKWTGSGNATTVGTITGDVTWTTGTTLNDIAVDAGGNLYCIIFLGANTYLYRINPTTLAARLVVQATGDFITNGTTTNGNGLAYLGDYFYYSRINGSNTDLWRIQACAGGVSTYVGSITGVNLGDLGSCATVTCVPADFSFSCLTGGSLQGGSLYANGVSQNNTLRVPLTSTLTGLVTFSVSGPGIAANPTSYTATLAQGATYVDIPITYDGSGAVGSRALTVTCDVSGAGSCAVSINVECAAGTEDPTLSAATLSNTCPTATADLTTLTASNMPAGSNVSLTWHTAPVATTLNKVATPTAVSAGTYYAAFYDAANNCYSNVGAATSPVVVTLTSCCGAGTTAPALSATSLTNTCPSVTVNLNTITASNTPVGATLTWHTGTPATTLNKISGTAVSAATAGTYYAAFYDATLNCYSGTLGTATTAVTVTTPNICITNPTAQTAIPNQSKLGNAATELNPQGGTTLPYVYSNGSSDPACTAPVGAMALPVGSNLIVNSLTGAYTYTAPSAPGTYYFCIKVCDSATPTANCKLATYTVTVACAVGSAVPGIK